MGKHSNNDCHGAHCRCMAVDTCPNFHPFDHDCPYKKPAANPPAAQSDGELKSSIIEVINSLDWTQAEFGYMPTDNEIADALLPLIASREQAAVIKELEKIDNAEMVSIDGQYVSDRIAQLQASASAKGEDV